MSKNNGLFRSFIVAFVVGLLFTLGCKKSNNGPASTVTATIGDSTFDVGTVSAVRVQQIFSVSLIGPDRVHSLEFGFAVPFQLNTPLTLDAPNVAYAWEIPYAPYHYVAGQYETPAGSASITVSSWDSVTHRIAGTFTGEVYSGPGDSLAITNGQFNVTYSVQN
jgi:hypothetical protein